MDVEIDPRLERTVWKALGVKSIRRIAEETGLEPEQILAIKRELFESVDDLTIAQRRQKLLVMMEQMAQDALERAANATDEHASGLFSAARGAMKDAVAELVRLSKSDESKITALNDLRKKEIVNLYTSVVDAGVQELSQTYEIPEDEMFAVFNRLLSDFAVKSLTQ